MNWIFSADFTLSKRHLGLLLMAGSTMVIVTMGGAEWLTSDGFGAAQKAATVLGLVGLAIGITLFPLGDRPA